VGDHLALLRMLGEVSGVEKSAPDGDEGVEKELPLSRDSARRAADFEFQKAVAMTVYDRMMTSSFAMLT